MEGEGGVKRDGIGEALLLSTEMSADLSGKSTEGSMGVEVDAGERGVDVVGASVFEAAGRTEEEAVDEAGV